jgi:hypothetical protein
LAAFVRTLLAAVSAALAMIDLMLPALSRTTLAHVGAESTELLGKPRSAGHKCGRRPARLGAIFVQSNAFCHLGDFLLAETGGAALLEFLSAPHAE